MESELEKTINKFFTRKFEENSEKVEHLLEQSQQEGVAAISTAIEDGLKKVKSELESYLDEKKQELDELEKRLTKKIALEVRQSFESNTKTNRRFPWLWTK